MPDYGVWTLPYSDGTAEDPAGVTWRNARILMDTKAGVLRIGDGVTPGGKVFYPGTKGLWFDAAHPEFFATTVTGAGSPMVLNTIAGQGYDFHVPALASKVADDDPGQVLDAMVGALTGTKFQVTFRLCARVINPMFQTLNAGLVLFDADKSHWCMIGGTWNGDTSYYGTLEYGTSTQSTTGIVDSTTGFTTSWNPGASPHGQLAQWYRVICDGTTLHILLSADGIQWNTSSSYFSAYSPGFALSTVLQGAPAFLGFGAAVYAQSADDLPNPDIDDTFGALLTGYRMKITYFNMEYLP